MKNNIITIFCITSCLLLIISPIIPAIESSIVKDNVKKIIQEKFQNIKNIPNNSKFLNMLKLLLLPLPIISFIYWTILFMIKSPVQEWIFLIPFYIATVLMTFIYVWQALFFIPMPVGFNFIFKIFVLIISYYASFIAPMILVNYIEDFWGFVP